MTVDTNRPAPADTTHLALLTQDGQRLCVARPIYRIGRGEECDLVIPQRGISLHHATLVIDHSGAGIIDEHSKNGTFINHCQVTPGQRVPLKPGDLLQISRSTLNEFAVEWMDAPAGQTTRQRIADGSRLLAMVAPLNAYLNDQEVLAQYLRITQSLVQTDRAMIIAVDENPSSTLTVLAATANVPTSRRPEELQMSLSAVREAFTSGQTIVRARLTAGGLVPQTGSAARYRLNTVIAVPLKVRELEVADGSPQTAFQTERILGVLYMDNKSTSDSFTDEHIAVLEFVADHAAMAVERARLHQRIVVNERSHAALQQELQLAADIQKQLLPTEFALCSFGRVQAVNLPAATASGDFYDLALLDDSRLSLTIGDVCGHGISAAVLMATTQACLGSAACRPHASPAWVVSEANRFMIRHCPLGRFVTACYAELHCSGLLTYVVAGHPSPVVLRRTGRCEVLKGTGPVMGIRELVCGSDPPFGENSICLDDGDLVLMFTDGLVEACKVLGFPQGIEAMTCILASQLNRPNCQTMLDTLIKLICKEQLRLEDDVTIVAVQYLQPRKQHRDPADRDGGHLAGRPRATHC